MNASCNGYPDHVLVDVNGRVREVEVSDTDMLVDTLRERLGLTGVKQPCAMGNCGACTVRLDGATVYSCLVLTIECERATIATIEGLADGDHLDPVQSAFIAADALQCGFCTPGQILSVRAILDETPDATDEQLIHGLTGNLCRCGAYQHILDAARLASTRSLDEDGANDAA